MSFHIHHFEVISTEKILAEDEYPMTYTDSKCKCGKEKGRYSLL